jgi:GNAT superfamily N-acetyltransferase
MQRNIVIKTLNEAEVSVEELYELRIAAFEQWSDAGLNIFKTPVEQFRRYIKDKTVFVAQDEATGKLLAMRTLALYAQKGRAAESNLSVASKAKRQGIATKLINYEVEWLKKNGYRYTTCSTAIPATWSVQWHLKNGYHIVGYSRSERNNYASYIFRKQIATDMRHHPTDLLWTKPVAPITAKIRYCLTWMATMVCKDNSGRLNAIGRIAKKVRNKL